MFSVFLNNLINPSQSVFSVFSVFSVSIKEGVRALQLTLTFRICWVMDGWDRISPGGPRYRAPTVLITTLQSWKREGLVL